MTTTSKRNVLIIFLALIMLLTSCNVSHLSEDGLLDSQAFNHSYTRQFGTAYRDLTTSVTTDANRNVYVAVNTSSGVEGAPDFAYLYKYDASGNFLQTISPPGCCGYWYTYLGGVVTDSQSNVYMSGYYEGKWPNNKIKYFYISKEGTGGSSSWVRTFREEPNTNGDSANVSVITLKTDAKSNLYMMFHESPYPYQSRYVHVRKYNARGRLLWESGLSSTNNVGEWAMATDASENVYMLYGTGFAKFDTQGNFLWSSTPDPSAYRRALSMTVDASGNIYLAGQDWDAPVNKYDAYVRKYDASGNIVWTQLFGGPGHEHVSSITTDGSGNVYVTGSTESSLQANYVYKGEGDVFVRKFDTNGNVLQTRQFGTTSFDIASNIVLDVAGNTYIAGSTRGNLQGVNRGFEDAFIRKYTP
jgi:Beta-propeller repeat